MKSLIMRRVREDRELEARKGNVKLTEDAENKIREVYDSYNPLSPNLTASEEKRIMTPPSSDETLNFLEAWVVIVEVDIRVDHILNDPGSWVKIDKEGK